MWAATEDIMEIVISLESGSVNANRYEQVPSCNSFSTGVRVAPSCFLCPTQACDYYLLNPIWSGAKVAEGSQIPTHFCAAFEINGRSSSLSSTTDGGQIGGKQEDLLDSWAWLWILCPERSAWLHHWMFLKGV